MTSTTFSNLVRTLMLGLLSALVFVLPSRGLPIYEQTLTLHPGWNAVYLEVTPETPEIASVFVDPSGAPLPILSVWQRQENLGQVDFIEDPGEALDRRAWRSYFPDQPEGIGFLSNLFALRGNQAYLVHFGGAASVQLTISGKPSLRHTKWVPDSFNLVGFHLEPSAPPSVADYFSSSPAHAGQPVYHLGSDGIWQLMSPNQSLQAGRSYWVFTTGQSTFQGPLEVVAPTREGLEFGSAIGTLDLSFRNHSGVPKSVTLEMLASADGSSLPQLAHWQLEEGQSTWPLLPASFSLAIDAGGERNAPLAVRRGEIDTHVSGLLRVSDGDGSRYLVPVSASPAEAGVAGLTGLSTAVAKSSAGCTGLWVGSATVNQVSEVRRNVKRICPCPASGVCPADIDGSIQACREDGDGLFCSTGPDADCQLVERGSDLPIPARREFDLRLLVHCDEEGHVKLLKEVTLMFEEGPDDQTAGSFVLVINDDRLHEFTGSALNDGVPVGTRVSTVAFDFEGTSLPLNGSLAEGQTLSANIMLAADAPTNPFRHRYHPDHNQLDEQYQEFAGESRMQLFEAFTIIREVKLVIDQETDSQAGGSLLAGTYEETISGLHRQAISVAGPLQLRRVSTVGELEQ